MKKSVFYIIDFDSTFVRVEALDELAKIALAGKKEQARLVEKIADITRQGMEGKIPFAESLKKRLALFAPHKRHIASLITLLEKNITPSILTNKQFFQANKNNNIYIISGGFRQYIEPVVKPFGIESTHVVANTFRFDKKGNVAGYDAKNTMADTFGKVNAVKKLGLAGEIIVIGDGITDYQVKEQGVANAFYAFTENVTRAGVVAKADQILKTLDDLLFLHDLPRSISFPKHRMKALFLEKIDQVATEAFGREGYDVESVQGSLSEAELCQKIGDVFVLGIRSKTEITPRVLGAAKRLLAIGAYCIGTNQIALPACSEKGVAVFNAPYSNTRSVVELTLGSIIMLYRKAFDKSSKLHKGEWDKSSEGCFELRGKKLGIIGYGNIGTQLGVLAESLGMQVFFYDVVDKLALGNAKKCQSLQELLQLADVVTVHVDGRKSNKQLIGKKEFSAMKDGVLFLNLSRGFIVDIDSLGVAVKEKKVAGCAVDVFPYEPKDNKETFVSALQGLPNTILTPHIGGSTVEAQKNIGEFVSQKLIDFINAGNTTLSVNFPQIQLPPQGNVHRFIHTHKNTPGVLAAINTVLAANAINIEGQYLKTNDEMGYVITDVNKEYEKGVLEELKKTTGTIRLRVLY